MTENISPEQRVVDTILGRFPVLEGRISIQNGSKRVVMEPLVRRDFEKVLAFLHDEAGFTTFHMVVGTDDGDNLGFYYVLSNADHVLLLLKEKAPRSTPNIKSVLDRYPNALWHERELVDLFGANVEALPEGAHYPLPDGWPAGNYPLRKDWKVEYFDKETMTYNPPQPAAAEADPAAAAAKTE